MQGFQPIFDRNSRILILGSFPSVKSRQVGFYYGNKRNRFWQTLRTIYGMDFKDSTEDKIKFLLDNHIALWDVAQQCDIVGSNDNAISNVVVADLNVILSQAKIEHIFCNGNKSYQIFALRYPELLAITQKLPSTSPANVSFDANVWIEAFEKIKK